MVAFIYSLEGRITDSVKQLGDLLLVVKVNMYIYIYFNLGNPHFNCNRLFV